MRFEIEKNTKSKRTHYDVTGVDIGGTRFKLTYKANPAGKFMAMNINLWRGSVWARYEDGTRMLLKRVWN